MKRLKFCALLCLALFTIPSAAQTIEPSAPTENSLPKIDAKAHQLLARLVARYKSFKTFRGVVEMRTSQPVPWKRQRQRLEIERYRGAVSTFTPAQGDIKAETTRRIFDGKQILETNASFAGQHTIEKRSDTPPSMERFLKSSGADFVGWNLFFKDDLAAGLLDPGLQSLAWGTTQTNGEPWQSIEIEHSGEFGDASLRLWIDVKKMELRRLEASDNTPRSDKKTFHFTEDYSEIVFDKPFPDATFSTQPSKNSRLVSSFDTSFATASKPVPAAEIK